MNNLVSSYFDNDKYIDIITDSLKTEDSKEYMQKTMTEAGKSVATLTRMWLLPFFMESTISSTDDVLSEEEQTAYDFISKTLETIKKYDRKLLYKLASKNLTDSKKDFALGAFILYCSNVSNCNSTEEVAEEEEETDDEEEETDDEISVFAEADSIDLELQEEYKEMKQ